MNIYTASKFIIFVCIGVLLQPLDGIAKESAWFRSESGGAKIAEIATLTLNSDYSLADQKSRKMRNHQPEHPGACVLQAMNTLARYDDLGNPELLKTARNTLQGCAANLQKALDQAKSNTSSNALSQSENQFWMGIIHFQDGYAATELGESLNGALSMRKGAKILETLQEYRDAQALHSIYGYYIDQLTKGLSWMPWVDDNRDQYIGAIRDAALNSPYFSPLFATTLTWVYYDRQEYQKAMTLVSILRKKSPNHRVFEQMEADVLFRMGNFQQARNIYEQSLKKYSDVAPQSVRWFCAIGNLMRICQEQGDSTGVSKYQKLLQHPEWNNIKPFMPGSLVKDLERRKLL